MLTLATRPTSGRILLDGESVFHEPIRHRNRFGYVPAEPFLYDLLTAREFLNFVADMRALPLAGRRTIIDEHLDRFDMAGDADRLIDLGWFFGVKVACASLVLSVFSLTCLAGWAWRLPLSAGALCSLAACSLPFSIGFVCLALGLTAGATAVMAGPSRDGTMEQLPPLVRVVTTFGAVAMMASVLLPLKREHYGIAAVTVLVWLPVAGLVLRAGSRRLAGRDLS